MVAILLILVVFVGYNFQLLHYKTPETKIEGNVNITDLPPASRAQLIDASKLSGAKNTSTKYDENTDNSTKNMTKGNLTTENISIPKSRSPLNMTKYKSVTNNNSITINTSNNS